MAELADAPDLGSGGRPCRFKSCYPQSVKEAENDLSFSVSFIAFLRDYSFVL